MRLLSLCTFVLTVLCFGSLSPAETAETASVPQSPESNNGTWHARLNIGLNPVVSSNDYLPTAHTGFGASLAAFLRLPYRFSAGAGFDWERYTFDSANYGDSRDAAPRYTDESLVHTRLMALVQWDMFRTQLITPYVLAGAGYGWEDADLTDWQCSPKLMHGPVLGTGLGLDFGVGEVLAVGLEYRVTTLPLGSRTCTLALNYSEPLGTPSDFASQRIGITLGVRN